MQNGVSVGPAKKKKKIIFIELFSKRWLYYCLQHQYSGSHVPRLSCLACFMFSRETHQTAVIQRKSRLIPPWFIPGTALWSHAFGFPPSPPSWAAGQLYFQKLNIKMFKKISDSLIMFYSVISKEKNLLSSNITTNFLILIYICPMGFSPIKID